MVTQLSTSAVSTPVVNDLVDSEILSIMVLDSLTPPPS
jgi:hypothetical protein